MTSKQVLTVMMMVVMVCLLSQTNPTEASFPAINWGKRGASLGINSKVTNKEF